MKKRSCTAQGLELQGVSLVFAACTLLLRWGAISFRPVLCRGPPYLLWPVFGPWAECGEFNQVYSGLLTEQVLSPFPLELPSKLSGQEMWWSQSFMLVFWRLGPLVLVLKQAWEGYLQWSTGGGAWCKQIMQAVLLLGCFKQLAHSLCCYVWGRGRAPANSFVPREVSQWMLPLRGKLRG